MWADFVMTTSPLLSPPKRLEAQCQGWQGLLATGLGAPCQTKAPSTTPISSPKILEAPSTPKSPLKF